MRRLLLIVWTLAGCVTSSQVGPYVKNVVRQGPWLMVEKCTIVLTGEHIEEGSCFVEQVPLHSVPVR